MIRFGKIFRECISWFAILGRASASADSTGAVYDAKADPENRARLDLAGADHFINMPTWRLPSPCRGCDCRRPMRVQNLQKAMRWIRVSRPSGMSN